MSRLYLGLDTSCYTTSLAAYADGQIISLKKPLEVKAGDCGLRQSEAFFQHSKNLPVLFEELKNRINLGNYQQITIAVSTRPRSLENSYMPVFTAGQNFARAVSSMTDAEYFEVSHQDGHIMAAIHSIDNYSILEKPFLVYHISGGTTELLLTEKSNDGFICRIVGGTKDLPAGQFIDRIGVKMGIQFPCGKMLDDIACSYDGEKPKKIKNCVNEAYINFSGEETRYSRELTKENKEFISYCTMRCIAESLKKSIIFAKKFYNVENVLMVGGVSSSEFLRRELLEISGTCFAEPQLCTDNAVGVCVIGRLKNLKLF